MTDFDYEHTSHDGSRFAIRWDEAQNCDAVLFWIGEADEMWDHIVSFDARGLNVSTEFSGSDLPVAVVRELVRRFDARAGMYSDGYNVPETIDRATGEET
ncbi:MAG: hypothetical protein EPO32_14690 [Anaerolineae bacterium]|nr:MAG: hypothetical protein EPO32_14690 [Anaerolineae bacterium]